MPDGNGIEFCKKIRNDSQIPILFLSCLNNEDTIVKGLNAGGDDYICKPFGIKELCARIESVLRRIPNIFNYEQCELEDIIDDIQEDLSYLNPTIHINQNIKLLCDYKWFVEAIENIIKNYLETNDKEIHVSINDYETTYNILIQDYGKEIDKKDLQN